MTLRIRWLGRVAYRDAHALQQGLVDDREAQYLLLLEHPPVYTLGRSADPDHVLVSPAEVGADLIATDRGGDVTYHGPGQLVGYPVLTVPGKRGGGMADTVAYVAAVEQVLIEALDALGLPGAGRLAGHPGVWIEPDGDRPRKIAAIGVRLARSRSMHGFALNVAPDLSMFDHIVPCGIRDKAVTSLRAEGVRCTMREVVDAVVSCAVEAWSPDGLADRRDVVWRESPEDLSAFSRGAGPGRAARAGSGSLRLRGRLAEAGVAGDRPPERKPEWMRATLRHGDEVLLLKRTMRELELATVCEEAGCPNLSECWADGTATFMINGERCTRACGFCLVDTRRPAPVDPAEAERVADAVERMGLDHAVITAVARDDLADGGAAAFAACVEAVRRRSPATTIELLVPDCKGDRRALDVIFASRPDVLNHNIETVPRLQRAVRPSAGYARSLAVLARARAAGLLTKSGIIVGMGETFDEVVSTLFDLRHVAVEIVTIGQYLQPTTNHLPVDRWWHPDEFAELRRVGLELGFAHVEAGPLSRSSYHAKAAARERSTPVA